MSVNTIDDLRKTLVCFLSSVLILSLKGFYKSHQHTLSFDFYLESCGTGHSGSKPTRFGEHTKFVPKVFSSNSWRSPFKVTMEF